jgi:hypothetical protein
MENVYSVYAPLVQSFTVDCIVFQGFQVWTSGYDDQIKYPSGHVMGSAALPSYYCVGLDIKSAWGGRLHHVPGLLNIHHRSNEGWDGRHKYLFSKTGLPYYTNPRFTWALERARTHLRMSLLTEAAISHGDRSESLDRMPYKRRSDREGV